jgi:hypothetical protein
MPPEEGTLALVMTVSWAVAYGREQCGVTCHELVGIKCRTALLTYSQVKERSIV